MSLDIFDKKVDQEIIPGPSGSFESQSPIEESELQLRKSTRKGYLIDLMRLRIMFSWYL